MSDIFFGANAAVFQQAEVLRNEATPAQNWLWSQLSNDALGIPFFHQHPCGKYILDFYSPQLNLAIEIDTQQTRFLDTKLHNEYRRETLKAHGIWMLRFTAETVLSRPHEVINLIAETIKAKKSGKAMPKNEIAVKDVVKENGLFAIPAIDIIDGKCVRLTQGDYAQKKVYNEHPLEVAKLFEDAGLKRLHLVDLDGAKAGAVKNWKVLEKIASQTKLIVDFGGGIKTVEDVSIVFEAGGTYATVGSIAVNDEELFTSWLQQFGAAKFFLGADVKNEKIAIHGWLETTDIWVYDFIKKYHDKGVEQIFCTDVSKDGKLEGPAVDLYKNIIKECEGINLTASGGVSSMDDMFALKEAGCTGAIIGKAIYENKISLQDLKAFQ